MLKNGGQASAFVSNCGGQLYTFTNGQQAARAHETNQWRMKQFRCVSLDFGHVGVPQVLHHDASFHFSFLFYYYTTVKPLSLSPALSWDTSHEEVDLKNLNEF